MNFQIGETRFEFEGFMPEDVAHFQDSTSQFYFSPAELHIPYHRDVFLSHITALSDGRCHGGAFNSDGQSIKEGCVIRRGEGTVVGFKMSEKGNTEYYKRAIYGGVLFSGFGHIILESASRLWAAREIPDLPILFQTAREDAAGKATLLVLADLLGISPQRIRFTSNDVNISRAYVPAPGLVLGEMISTRHLDFIRTALAKFQGRDGPLTQTYLSRAGLSWKQRRGVGEAELENALRSSDYNVVRTESMSLSDQIAVVNNSSTLAGFIGSQLHLLLFRSSPTPIDVLYLCSSRPNLNFLQLDLLFPGRRVYCNVTSYGPAFEFGSRSPFLYDPVIIKSKFDLVGMRLGDYCGPSISEFMFDWALAYFHFKVFREGILGGKFAEVAERRISRMVRGFNRRLSSDEISQVVRAFAECARCHEYHEDLAIREVEKQLIQELMS